MTKSLWVLVFLFFEIILETGFYIASALMQGLSVKNILIYGMLGVMMFTKFFGPKRLNDRYVSSISNFYLFYLLFCAIHFLLLMNFPANGYDAVAGLWNLKSDLFDTAICFFLFKYFSDTPERAESIFTVLLFITGVAALATLLDAVVMSGGIFGFDEDSNRPNGAFGEPNQTAVIFALASPFLLAQIIISGKMMKLIYIGMAAVMLAAIACTGSRGGMLGAGFGALWFLLFVRRQLSIGNKLLAIMGTPILVLLAWSLMPGYYQELIISRFSFFTEDAIDYGQASAGRLDIWEFAFLFWAERPVFGWGWKGFQIIVGGSPHSVYVERLTDTGLIGFVLFLILQFKIWHCVFLTMKDTSGGIKVKFAGMSAGIIGLYVSLLFVNIYLPAIIAWSFLGVMIGYANQVRLELIRNKIAQKADYNARVSRRIKR